MTPIQQMFLGLGAANKTYIDNVFSNYLYKGTGSNQTITNNLDLATEGGMVWIKNRSDARNHVIGDSVRGDNKYVVSASANGQGTNDARFRTLTTTGFEVGSDNDAGVANDNYGSWSFRKAKGFFDVLSYTGSGSDQTISHSLGCIPGCIMIKRTDSNADWGVYHRRQNGGVTPWNYRLKLNSDGAEADANYFGDVAPTSNQFTVGGSHGEVNASGGTYIAYLFAGGASTAATAKSIELDGSDDYFQTSTSTDFEFSGDFTFECWFNPQTVSGNRGIFTLGQSNLEGGFELYASNKTLKVDDEGTTKSFGGNYLDMDQWYHIAFVRSGTKNTLYLNGTDIGNYTSSHTYGINSGGNRSTIMMGTGYNGAVEHFFDGNISNVRVLNGTALYTSSFRPPTEPLTNITNTKLLCCNNSSVTGSTVAPTTLTASGTVASTKHPFDDKAAFTFGDNKEGIIKCGSFTGNGSTTGPEIYLGWEPQWLLLKRADGSGNWHIHDSMRGIITNGNDALFRANNGDAEESNTNIYELTPTGFRVVHDGFHWNTNGGNYMYVAIRRPDGYVGKPAEAGTDVFATDTGDSSSTIPTFDSGFPVDFAFIKTPDSTSWEWYNGTRLTGKQYMYFNSYAAEGVSSDWKWDSNLGWNTTGDSSYQSWMFKRHAGFDVVATEPGNGTAHVIKHNLGKTPEMIWTKKRATSNWGSNSSEGLVLDNWFVWHKDDHASAAVGYLNSNADGGLDVVYTDSVDSVSAKFHSNITYSGDENMMYFFASVDGICKVGSYTGNGSTTGPSVTTGFQPRLLIVKNAGGTGDWLIYDSLRGFGTVGQNHGKLVLNSSASQTNASTFFQVSSTGFSVHDDSSVVNTNSSKYIYYAHA